MIGFRRAGAVVDRADFVIVGTGAGGATAARVLSDRGFDVVLLEEGGPLHPEGRPRELLDAMSIAVRGMATQSTDSLVPMPVLQGRGVGGSTAINSGIVWRMPDDVRRAWAGAWGLEGLVGAPLDDAFRTMEEELGVGPTDARVTGTNNTLLARAAETLGLPGKVIDRNARGCEGNQRCLQGCPVGARQSMEVSYVPRAIAKGARLHTEHRVERVRIERGRATGVEGMRRTARGDERFVVEARRGVIVAASVIQTPLLLAASGVRHPLLGERFQAHPGAAIVGRFDTPVHMGAGVSQGYEIPMRAQGFKIEALALPPDMLAARLPGAGAAWQERVAELGHYAQWGSLARMEALGRVRRGVFGNVSIRYEPTKKDLAIVREALLLVGRLFFAAGAREIYPGLGCMPEIVTSEAEFLAAMPHELARADVHLVASHLFGTACAASDPARGVVDARLAVRGVEGLYAMDASVFPTNLGVNPQHSIMGVVWCASEALAARETERRVA